MEFKCKKAGCSGRVVSGGALRSVGTDPDHPEPWHSKSVCPKCGTVWAYTVGSDGSLTQIVDVTEKRRPR